MNYQVKVLYKQILYSPKYQKLLIKNLRALYAKYNKLSHLIIFKYYAGNNGHFY